MLDDEKPKLQILCKAFDWMIQDAQYTTVQKVVVQAALEAENRPVYKLTRRQQIAIHEVRKVIQEFQEWKEDQPKTEDGDESDDEIEFMGRIRQEILRLFIDLLNHLLQDNEYKSAIISGLAVLGIRDDDRWLDVEDYTPKYSAVIKLTR